MARARIRLYLLLALTCFASSPLQAQAADEPSPKTQQAAFAQAQQDFAAGNWPLAFSEFNALHLQSPDNTTITEYLAEAALNLGRQPLAIQLLAPIAHATPNHWQAVALLARAYAETNQDTLRDATVAQLQTLHDSGDHPKLSHLDQFRLERHLLPTGGEIDVWYSLHPWGKFNAYLYARYTDSAGKEQAYMTLESSDTDQALWAQQHPTEAAAGQRVFSLDAYTVATPNGAGGLTRTQSLLGFYNGKPAYNLIRDKMLQTLTAGAQTHPPTHP